jgi:hypothetical protein
MNSWFPSVTDNVTITSVAWTTPAPCAGCGTAYLINATNPFHPHSEIECVAYRRGFEDGKAAKEREVAEK